MRRRRRWLGSWAVEALARSGIGALTLVDLDDVCVTNVNRQLHALDGEIGRTKIDVMARRAQAINPGCVIRPLHTFFTETNAAKILEDAFRLRPRRHRQPDKKCLLIASCRDRELRVMVVGGAGGRQNPGGLKITDLALSSHDRLLAVVRSTLRGKFGFSRSDKPFGIDCVYSPEPVLYPQQDGTVCAKREEGSTLRLDCETGYGTACS